MKILHVHENLALKGGIETYLLSLIPRLEERGCENAIAYGSGNGALVARSYPVPALGRGNRAARREGAQQIGEVIEQYRPDVIHLHNMYNTGAIDACLCRAPTVLTGHDFRYVCPASSFFYKRTQEICPRRCGPACFTTTLTKRCLSLRPSYALQYYRRVRWMAKNWPRLGTLIAPSQAAMDRFVEAGMPAANVKVLPYFCPIEPLKSPRATPATPTILFLGRLSPTKGYHYFIKALGLLPKHVRGILIANLTDANRPGLQQLADEAGCGDRLELRPWADRDVIAATIRQATVVCFPSIWPETLGIVGLESLAQGVPVVASDVGGVREWLLPGETGVLVRPKDFRGIAAGVQQFLDSPALATKMGTTGLRLIETKFNPDRHVDRLQAVYEDVAARRNSSSAVAAGAGMR